MDDVLKPGTLLRDSKYEILELLREPSNKKIYRALDRGADREVALDVLTGNLIVPGGMTVREWEVEVLAQLSDHPNIATVLDHWDDGHIAAMVTLYLTGGRLSDRIDDSMRESGHGLPLR